MEKRYEIQESKTIPWVGKLVARALGDAYVSDGGFYDPSAGNPRRIVVGRGSKEGNVDAILAAIGDARVTGNKDYVNAVDFERYVRNVERRAA